MRDIIIAFFASVLVCIICMQACNTPVVFVSAAGVVCGCITPANKDMPTLTACTTDVLNGKHERIVVRECE